MSDMGLVYILHFSRKLHHTQHYCGFSKNKRSLNLRIAHHIAGSGSRLCRAVALLGIEITLSRVFLKKDRNFERSLKKTCRIHHYCPTCNPNAPDYHPRKVRIYDPEQSKYIDAATA